MELAPGDRVDRYVLRARLGEGGQGEVWRADDPLDAEHPKALKLVGVASASPNQLERLRREARRLVQLRHPSLIACHGLFEDLHRDLLGVVMEYADGQSLDDAMADARLTEDKRMLVLAHVAGALAHVHQRNVVHRDIKLENVVVTHAFWDAPQDPATVKLIDFGIAVESDNPKPLTKLGCVIGTPPYLAPELLDPSGWNHTGGATPTADVFAFGVLAWKLLLGHSAHPSGLPNRSSLGDYAVAYRASAGGPWPPEAPQAAWASVIARCLALDFRERVKNALDLVSELARAMPGFVLPTAEQVAPAPVAGEKRTRTELPTVQLGAGPHTETAPKPVPLRESTPRPSAPTSRQAPDFAPWSPAPQRTSEPVVQPSQPVAQHAPHYAPQPVAQYVPQPIQQYAPPESNGRGLWVLGALFVLGAGVVALGAGVASHEGWLPGSSAVHPSHSARVTTSRPIHSAVAPVADGPSSVRRSGMDSAAEAPKQSTAACDPCQSHAECVANCTGLLDPKGHWHLRLWGLTTVEHPKGEFRSDVEVCVTRLRDSSRKCFKASDARPEAQASAPELDVSYADLTSTGLHIAVTRNVAGLRVGYDAKKLVYRSVYRNALCQGLKVEHFLLKKVKVVNFHLDPPDRLPSERCPTPQ